MKFYLPILLLFLSLLLAHPAARCSAHSGVSVSVEVNVPSSDSSAAALPTDSNDDGELDSIVPDWMKRVYRRFRPDASGYAPVPASRPKPTPAPRRKPARPAADPREAAWDLIRHEIAESSRNGMHKPRPKWTGWCARYTCRAINRALDKVGVKVDLICNNAEDLPPNLEMVGFKKVLDNTDVGAEEGDVVIIQPFKKHKHGHAGIKNSLGWSADGLSLGWNPYADVPPVFAIYRYMGPLPEPKKAQAALPAPAAAAGQPRK